LNFGKVLEEEKKEEQKGFGFMKVEEAEQVVKKQDSEENIEPADEIEADPQIYGCAGFVTNWYFDL
jgi:hypothetical protein